MNRLKKQMIFCNSVIKIFHYYYYIHLKAMQNKQINYNLSNVGCIESLSFLLTHLNYITTTLYNLPLL